MRHVPDGTLRRLVDEPFAVAERDIRHLDSCKRCRSRATRVDRDGGCAQQYFSPVPLASSDAGWRRFVGGPAVKPSVRSGHLGSRRRWRLMGASVGAGTSIAAAAVLVAGIAAAATLTTVFAPTRVAPVPVSKADVEQLTSYLGLSGGDTLGGFPEPSGSETLPYGTLSWSSSARPAQVASLEDAESAAGFSISLPSSLPSGVGSVAEYVVAPTVTATITFNSSAGAALSGSTITMTVGPGIGVTYAGENGSTRLDNLPPLAILEAPRPTATSTGATTSELENFLLSRPGVPADLAREIKLLGNPSTTLPVPTPSGVTSTSMQIDGVPGVVFDDGNDASAAIWEDQNDMVHVVAGLLDQGDLLGVARQIS